MAIYHAAIGFPFDTALPRDVVTLHPHYIGDNPQALADKLKANLIANTGVGAKPFTVKVYDAEKAAPSYPLATASQTGTTPTSNAPRELSLCLSYYGIHNRPSTRGRMYIPLNLLGVYTTTARPSGPQMNNALLWSDVFRAGMPANTNWGVWSRKNKAFTVATNWWVDDEWDIVRSRGMRGTTRVAAP